MMATPLALPEQLHLHCKIDNEPVPDMLVHLTFMLEQQESAIPLRLIVGPSDQKGDICVLEQQLRNALNTLGWSYLPQQIRSHGRIGRDAVLRRLSQSVSVCAFTNPEPGDSSNSNEFPLLGGWTNPQPFKQAALDALRSFRNGDAVPHTPPRHIEVDTNVELDSGFSVSLPSSSLTSPHALPLTASVCWAELAGSTSKCLLSRGRRTPKFDCKSIAI